MPLITVRVELDEQEYRALLRLGEQEYRPLVLQARALICADLRRRGLLMHEEAQIDAVTA
ncbi:MAG: hypothetical protein AB7R89_23085 [Dehalococcoidia bacterium]